MRKKINILVIEDNEPDYVLLEKALSQIEDIDITIINMENGQKGIDYVFKSGKFKNVETPDIIILDLNLPVKNGFEVLESIKSNPLYKIIPIIIYSTSTEDGDVHSSYALYANSYISKTFDVKELFEKIRAFGEYWIKSVEIPYSD